MKATAERKFILELDPEEVEALMAVTLYDLTIPAMMRKHAQSIMHDAFRAAILRQADDVEAMLPKLYDALSHAR